jgi:hypothetical protein
MKTRTMKNAIVTKSQLAAELECGSGTLSRIRDLPVRPDGQLNRAEVLQWLSYYTSGFGGGWGARRGKAGLQERAARLLKGQPASEGTDATDGHGTVTAPVADPFAGIDTEGPEYIARRELLDRILGNAQVIPELALKLGCQDMGLAITFYEIFRTLVLALTDGIEAEVFDWSCGDDIPNPHMDYAKLAAKHKVPYGPESETRAEALWTSLDKLTESGEFTRMLPSRQAPKTRRPKKRV